MNPPPFHLPHAFLSEPGPEVRKETIDFKRTDLQEYEGYYACILDNVLTAEECTNLTRAARLQANGDWQQATINTGFTRQQVDTESRLCGRIIWDNVDLAAKILA